MVTKPGSSSVVRLASLTKPMLQSVPEVLRNTFDTFETRGQLVGYANRCLTPQHRFVRLVDYVCTKTFNPSIAPTDFSAEFVGELKQVVGNCSKSKPRLIGNWVEEPQASDGKPYSIRVFSRFPVRGLSRRNRKVCETLVHLLFQGAKARNAPVECPTAMSLCFLFGAALGCVDRTQDTKISNYGCDQRRYTSQEHLKVLYKAEDARRSRGRAATTNSSVRNLSGGKPRKCKGIYSKCSDHGFFDHRFSTRRPSWLEASE